MQGAREYLNRIMTRNPDLYIKNMRSLTEDLFVTIGRGLVELVTPPNEIYLTSFSLDYGRVNLRLWTEKPDISNGYHGWDHRKNSSAVAEMEKQVRHHYHQQEDAVIFHQILRGRTTADPEKIVEIIKGPEGWYPDRPRNESRIYLLKKPSSTDE